MELIKIILLSITATILCLILRNNRPEFAVFVSIAAAVMILSLLSAMIGIILQETKEFITKTGIDSAYFEILLKCVGVAYLTHFASDICSDAGEKAISSKVELTGRIVILYLSMPVFINLLKVVSAMV